MSADSGRNSGGDLFDMAQDGTKVPDDAATPRYIPSKPRPDQIASASDPNYIGGTNLAEAATNQGDIPRTTKDDIPSEILTGTGDSLPSQVGSKRLHQVPGGVITDPFAKGSTRMAAHKVQSSDIETGASDGPQVDKAPGDEGLTEEEAMDKYEIKETS